MLTAEYTLLGKTEEYYPETLNVGVFEHALRVIWAILLKNCMVLQYLSILLSEA